MATVIRSMDTRYTRWDMSMSLHSDIHEHEISGDTCMRAATTTHLHSPLASTAKESVTLQTSGTLHVCIKKCSHRREYFTSHKNKGPRFQQKRKSRCDGSSGLKQKKGLLARIASLKQMRGDSESARVSRPKASIQPDGDKSG